MIVTLLVATGSGWETTAFGALNAHPGVVVLKRCVDLDDLLAAASTGQAEVAVVGADLVGLDAAAVADLAAQGVRLVAVAPDVDAARPAAERIGITALAAADPVDDVVALVLAPPAPSAASPTRVRAGDGLPDVTAPGGAPLGPATSTRPGRVIAVWGPGGAPGRTTVASALAADLARRELTTVLLDADPYGGCVAQQLGILDEVSGLLAAARLVTAGTLEERVASTQRRLSDRLWVVTGLPRADRWVEVRAGTVEALIEHLRLGNQVVIDTGFSLEQDPQGPVGSRPERNGLTLEALACADEVVVVGAADPVGLARLARGLSELQEQLPGVVPHVVVNRMRSSLGWREREVAQMLAGFGAVGTLCFLPEDQAAVDRALVSGRSLIESGDSALVRAVGGLVEQLAGLPARPAEPAPVRGSRRRLRR